MLSDYIISWNPDHKRPKLPWSSYIILQIPTKSLLPPILQMLELLKQNIEIRKELSNINKSN